MSHKKAEKLHFSSMTDALKQVYTADEQTCFRLIHGVMCAGALCTQ